MTDLVLMGAASPNIVETINGIVWGIPMLSLLLLTGLFLTIGLRFMPWLKMGYGFSQLFKKRDDAEEGDVSPFSALMTALSSTIGTGNIAGVAAAIVIGGPGAIFWMWMTALMGMATKYAEGVLAVKFREQDEQGNNMGGPMYYIKNGLGKAWIWLAVLFALFAMFASWGTGAYIQSNTVADTLNAAYEIPHWATGIVLAVGAALVILGGIKRIANFASFLVPGMAGLYIAAGLIIIFLNIGQVPAVFMDIVKSAFGMREMATGTTIGLLVLAMQTGVARGIFSNEAGQGSAPIAHAAAKNNDPVNQGVIAMLGTFIDTIMVCSITAFAILTAGVIPEGCQDPMYLAALTDGTPAECKFSGPLTVAAFDAALPFGKHIVAIGLAIFAFTTIIGWSYYGERAAQFLFGRVAIMPFKIMWILVVLFGSLIYMIEGDAINNVAEFSWLVADTLTGLMAAPNLVALLLLSPLVFRLTKEYFDKKK